MASIRARLAASQKAMHAAGERLERATEARDNIVLEASEEPHSISKSELARLLGVRRETVYNAILRAQGRQGRDGDGEGS
jgi:hypothetical protein